MISVSNPIKQLKNILKTEGFNIENPNIDILWKAFKQFSDTKFEAADDSFLFQCGTFNFTGEKLFYWDLVRQFCFEEKGEYDHMEQLHMEFIFAPSNALKGFQDIVWSYDFKSIDEFFIKVYKYESFREPWIKCKPIDVRIFQEQV